MNATWKKVRLGEVLTPVCREEVVDPVREYRLLGVRLDGQGPFLRETVLGSQTAAHKLCRVVEGDFIYSRLFACRGAFGIIGPELDGCYVSGEFPAFVPVEGKIDVRFLRYWFRLADSLDRVNEDCTGSTPLTRNRFKEQFFLALEIPLPSLAEQRRIVTRIEKLADKIAEAISLRHQAVEEAESLVLSALLHLERGPKWERKRISDSSQMSTGTTPPSERSDYYGGPLQWYTPGDLNNQRQLGRSSRTLSEAAVREGKARLFCPGTVLLVAIGGSLGKVGLTHERCSANQQITGIKFNATILPEFGFLWMQRLSKALMDAAPHATLPIINQARIGQFEIVVPPLTEQRRIVAYFDGLQAKVDALKKLQTETAAELDALLPSVLDRAFVGAL